MNREGQVKIFDAGIQDFQRADEGSAGVDIRSSEDIVLVAGAVYAIPTGIHMELPIGIEFQIRSRSGLALNKAVHVLNAPGTVDSTFRGEVKVILMNSSKQDFAIAKGDRIAQGVFAEYKVPHIRLVTFDQLSETKRGTGGFGSSGIK